MDEEYPPGFGTGGVQVPGRVAGAAREDRVMGTWKVDGEFEQT